jgi:hypothetical protein
MRAARLVAARVAPRTPTSPRRPPARRLKTTTTARDAALAERGDMTRERASNASKLAAVRAAMKRRGVQAVIVPSQDPHFRRVGEARRERADRERTPRPRVETDGVERARDFTGAQ